MANVGFRVYFLGCIYISPMEPMGNHGVTYVFLVRNKPHHQATWNIGWLPSFKKTFEVGILEIHGKP